MNIFLNLKWKKQPDLIKILCILLGAVFLFGAESSAASSDLVINEIMYDAKGADAKHEWIELYNAGANDIDLTGAKLNDGDGTTNHALNAPPKNNSRGSIVIPPGSFLLLADDAATLADDLPDYSGSIIDTVMALSNEGATLRIIDKDGNELAVASYSKSSDMTGNGKTLQWSGSSFSESPIPDGTPGAANDFTLPETPSPSPSSTPEPSASPSPSSEPSDTPSPQPLPSSATEPASYQFSKDIYLSEFLPNPLAGQNEWVELYNAGSKTVNLEGWQIGNAADRIQVIPEGTIKAGDFLVVALSGSFLNNEGGQIKLLWPDNQIIHSATYGQAEKNLAAARFDNKWLWTNQLTPGQENKRSIFPQLIQDEKPSQPVVALKESVPAASSGDADQPINSQTQPAQSLPETIVINETKDQPQQIKDQNTAATAEQTTSKNSETKKLILVLGAILLMAAAMGYGLARLRKRSQIDTE